MACRLMPGRLLAGGEVVPQVLLEHVVVHHNLRMSALSKCSGGHFGRHMLLHRQPDTSCTRQARRRRTPAACHRGPVKSRPKRTM
jgi:hypothetical protein